MPPAKGSENCPVRNGSQFLDTISLPLTGSPHIPEVPAPLMTEGKPFTWRAIQKAYPKEQPPEAKPRHADEILPNSLHKPR